MSSHDFIDWRATRTAIVLLLPVSAMAVFTGDDIWLRAALVTISSFIAASRGELSPEGSALHAIGIQVAWLALWATMPIAPLFAVVMMVLAAVALRFVGAGERYRPVGLFLAVPAIYLSFQFAHAQHDASMGVALGESMTLAEGSIPVLVWQLLRSRKTVSLPRHASLTEAFDRAFTWPSLLVPVGVGATAWLTVRWHMPDGQWLVWSSLVVAYGSPEISWNKFMDRAMGACMGAPVGALAASYLPAGHGVAVVAMIAAVLTLVTIRRYVVAYAVRSALIVVFITFAFDDHWSAMLRVALVVGGGAIGMTFYGIAVVIHRLLSQRQPS